jgi:uncharacterized protein (TIGR04255 family)
MAKPQHLNNAPITEALIDIHVEPRVDISFDELQDAFSKLDFGYYIKAPISYGTLGVQLTLDGLQPKTSMESAQIGLRLHSDDEKFVAQCRLTGFTLSRLSPYDAWPALVQETKRIWSIYRERLEPVRVSRVATRFINNLQLPLEYGESFQIYLQKFADVPDEAPQAMTSFFQRFQLMDKSSTVNLTLVLETVPQGGPVPVILDIDAFAVKELDPQGEELWNILEELRDLKNRCFFGSLTDRALELYK